MTTWTNTISASLLNRTVGRGIVDSDHLDELERAKAQLLVTARDVTRLYRLGIPDSILAKPAELTDEEMRFVRTHPIYGLEIVAPLKGLLGTGVSVIRHHHERYDGRGYPDGLAGKAIPIAARLFSVVDAFDAMNSDRPYRSAPSMSEAIHRLRGGSGRQFDPGVVQVFSELVG
jgi:HD-GYP domain-containing protein (c-di-GMP phosphodiesterase class II)